MSFVLKQLADVGSANPIVARLSLQFSSILDFYQLDDEFKKAICGILHDDIQKRLISCDKIATEIVSEIETAITALQESGLKTQSAGRVIEFPHILNLEVRLASYLYNAKSCLRDALKIYNKFFGSTFTEARFDNAICWAKKEFGENDPIVKFLKKDHDLWIHKVVKMRNAAEHPGGHSGHLHIKNFEVDTTSTPPLIHEPLWYLNDEQPTPIRGDLHVFVNNILELTEDIVLSALSKQEKPESGSILEIPEVQRREEAPIRFRIGLEQEFESNN
ncbi:hypothetical protein BK026_04210 [Alteromonas sp. V450]|uniref:hypothetical protein n=1 Tax=Alteromonas sp. V450 TaxID=1912139 RepID=UPI0008FF130D|nr:hypothetical protein [Alteromonas sp. V450]OJF68045.1 hypothetical protein BK026_04210 [Alteromonas sp. V450]